MGIGRPFSKLRACDGGIFTTEGEFKGVAITPVDSDHEPYELKKASEISTFLTRSDIRKSTLHLINYAPLSNRRCNQHKKVTIQVPMDIYEKLASLMTTSMPPCAVGRNTSSMRGRITVATEVGLRVLMAAKSGDRFYIRSIDGTVKEILM